MGLRLAGVAVGAQFGVTGAVIGVVVAQVVTTVSILGIGPRESAQLPRRRPVPLGEDARPIVRFVAQSAAYTGLISVRTWVAPLTLGIVRDARAVGLFRAAQMPQTGFAALSSPLRMILLTEQTRDWEHGRREQVIAGDPPYVAGAAAVRGDRPRAGALAASLARADRPRAGTCRRFRLRASMLVAAAIQLVFSWTKSFPVTIGRPGLRLVAHGVETVVMLPLIIVFGREWGVTGAGAAVLVSSVAFALTWLVIVLRLRRPGGLGTG